MSYLSCIPSADETKPPTILQVDADFLDQVIAHARSSNNIGGKFGALADYLTRTAPIHRNIAVLERLAVVQLRKYSEGGLYRDPGDAAVRLTEIARQRRLLDLNAPPLMLALKNDADVWRESLKDLIQRFVMHRSDELAKLESILTSEGLVSALADTMPKNEYCDFVTQLLAHSNLRDPAVFKMLLTSVESALRADPRRDWIVCVETRLNRNLYVENIPIETMAQAFLDSLPNKG